MNLRTEFSNHLPHPMKFKHLKNNTLNTRSSASGVGLTLVKMCIIFCCAMPLHGQYLQIKPKQEVALVGGMALHSGINLLIEHNHWGGSVRSWEVPVLDGLAQYRLQTSTAKISDGMALGTAMAAGMLTLALPKNQRSEYAAIGLQNVWITANLTQTVKVFAARNRPYTHAPGFVSNNSDDHYSFFSGHSSITATAATTAIMMALNQPNMPTWGKTAAYTAGGLAITTATLRIAAGKHYPSDVVTGILVGVGVALINTKLHEAL
jgi:membrane-associated phospholipid phosphatase